MDIIERLRAMSADTIGAEAADTMDSLRAELVAAQAYAERLREALSECKKLNAIGIKCDEEADEAIAIPADHAALTERLAQERKAGQAEGLRMGAQGVEDNAWACHIESILHKTLMSNAAALRVKADEMERQPSTKLHTD